MKFGMAYAGILACTQKEMSHEQDELPEHNRTLS